MAAPSSSSSGSSLVGGDASNTTTARTAASTDNHNSNSNSNSNNNYNSGSDGGQAGTLVATRPSGGSDVIMHVSREGFEWLLLTKECPVSEIAGSLVHEINDRVHDYVLRCTPALDNIMRFPVLYRSPAYKELIRDIVEEAIEAETWFIEGQSKDLPDRSTPNALVNIMEDLKSTHYYQSTLAGVVVDYIFHGKGQVEDKTPADSPQSPLHNDEGSDDMSIVGPSDSSTPPSPMAKSQAIKKMAYSVADKLAVDDASGGSSDDDANDDDCSSPKQPPPSLSSSTDKEATYSSASPPSPKSKAMKKMMKKMAYSIAEEKLAVGDDAANSGSKNDDDDDDDNDDVFPGSDNKPPSPLFLSTEMEATSSTSTIVEPPTSAPPSPMASSQAKKASIAEEIAVDDASDITTDDSYNDVCPGFDNTPPLALSSSTDKEATHHSSAPPPSPKSQAMKKMMKKMAYAIAEEKLTVGDDAANSGSNDDEDDDDDDDDDDDEDVYPGSNNKPPPQVSASSDDGSAATATPSPTSPSSLACSCSSSSSMDDDSTVTQRTFSESAMGGMFHPHLDNLGVAGVIEDTLCSNRVMNDRGKAAKVMREVKSGCVSGETMMWIVRGLRSVRGKREMKQRHGGLVFVGPRLGVPLYRTGNGVDRMLRGVAKKHGAGTKFVVCVSSTSTSGSSSSSNNNIATLHNKMITGILCNTASAAASSAASATSDTSSRVEPVMDGDALTLKDWCKIRGNLDDGCRLWAWVY